MGDGEGRAFPDVLIKPQSQAELCPWVWEMAFPSTLPTQLQSRTLQVFLSIGEIEILIWYDSQRKDASSFLCSSPGAGGFHQYHKVTVFIALSPADEAFHPGIEIEEMGLARVWAVAAVPFLVSATKKAFSGFFQVFPMSTASKNVQTPLYLPHPEVLHSHTSPHSASSNFWQHFSCIFLLSYVETGRICHR